MSSKIESRNVCGIVIMKVKTIGQFDHFLWQLCPWENHKISKKKGIREIIHSWMYTRSFSLFVGCIQLLRQQQSEEDEGIWNFLILLISGCTRVPSEQEKEGGYFREECTNSGRQKLGILFGLYSNCAHGNYEFCPSLKDRLWDLEKFRVLFPNWIGTEHH